MKKLTLLSGVTMAVIGVSACQPHGSHQASVSDHWNVKLLPESRMLGFALNEKGVPTQPAIAIDAKYYERDLARGSVSQEVAEAATANLDNVMRNISGQLGYGVSPEQRIAGGQLQIVNVPDASKNAIPPNQRVVWRCLVADNFRFSLQKAKERYAAPEAAKNVYAKAFGIPKNKIQYRLSDNNTKLNFMMSQPNVCLAYQALSVATDRLAQVEGATGNADCASFLPYTKNCLRQNAELNPYYLSESKPYSEKIMPQDYATDSSLPAYRLRRVTQGDDVFLTLCQEQIGTEKQQCSVIKQNQDAPNRWNASFNLGQLPQDTSTDTTTFVQLKVDAHIEQDGRIALKQAYMTYPTYRYSFN